jgi:hypothetical protein
VGASSSPSAFTAACASPGQPRDGCQALEQLLHLLLEGRRESVPRGESLALVDADPHLRLVREQQQLGERAPLVRARFIGRGEAREVREARELRLRIRLRQVAPGIRREPRDFGFLVAGHQLPHAVHEARSLASKRRLERCARLAVGGEADAPDPLVAPREHRLEEVARDGPVAVEMPEQPLQRGRRGIVRFEQQERALCGLAIQFLRVLDDRGRRAEAREHRHLPREGSAQRVDRLDAKARGILEELPAAGAIAREGGAGKLPGEAFVRQFGRRLARRALQRLEHAAAHLRGGLARERDREDLLWLVDFGQQAEQALREHGCLARAGRRLQQD